MNIAWSGPKWVQYKGRLFARWTNIQFRLLCAETELPNGLIELIMFEGEAPNGTTPPPFDLPCLPSADAAAPEVEHNLPTPIAGLPSVRIYKQLATFRHDALQSVSDFDPFERRVLAVALAPSELVGVAEIATTSSSIARRSKR